MHEARDGEDAIRFEKTYAGRIDLVVSDVVMPGVVGGRELVNRLAALRPGLKALFVSGYAQEMVGRHGVNPKRVAFLHKPFTTAGLAQKVREVLDATS